VKNRKVLITGGNGFIGSYLSDKLSQNNFNVVVVDKFDELFREPIKSIKQIRCEIDDFDKYSKELKQTEILFHLAATFSPSSSKEKYKSEIISNLFSSIDLFERAAKSGVRKIVLFSSGGSVYGNHKISKIGEGAQTNPISTYGINKLIIEKYLKFFAKKYDFDFLIVRPSNPYGPRQNFDGKQGVISIFLKKIIDGDKISIFGSGNDKKDYIYIDDLISLLFILIKNNCKGTYNLGSGLGYSINDFLKIFKSTLNLDFKINFCETQNYDVVSFILDNSKVLNHNKFKFTPIHDGIKKTYNWIKEINEINSK